MMEGFNQHTVRSRSIEYNDIDEDEMVATERELAEDAQWKKIQQNTFTRWANEHLKTVEKHIGNLETDLSDGLRLITLIEVLSGRKLPKYNKRPSFRSQKLENVSVALKFLQDDEGIRIVNIGMLFLFNYLLPDKVACVIFDEFSNKFKFISSSTKPLYDVEPN